MCFSPIKAIRLLSPSHPRCPSHTHVTRRLTASIIEPSRAKRHTKHRERTISPEREPFEIVPSQVHYPTKLRKTHKASLPHGPTPPPHGTPSVKRTPNKLTIVGTPQRNGLASQTSRPCRVSSPTKMASPEGPTVISVPVSLAAQKCYDYEFGRAPSGCSTVTPLVMLRVGLMPTSVVYACPTILPQT